MKTICLYLLLTCLLLSCRQPVDQAALRSAIEKANQEWMDGVARKDADAVAAVYTEDTKVMAPNAPAVSGRAGAKDFITAGLNAGISAIKLTTEDVYGTDEWAVESGKYEIMAGDARIDVGKYVVGWKNVNGKWLIHKDIFNSDLPVPVPTVAQPVSQ